MVIPAYNLERYIARAIRSVLAQSRLPEEIIVVDDGSTDDTAARVHTFGPKVRYLYQEHRGQSAARNTGIQAAQREWIAFLDGDDEWLEDYLRCQTELLARHPQLRWSGSNFFCYMVTEQRKAPLLDPDEARRLLGGKDYFENYFHAFRHRASGSDDTLLVHREVFEQIGYFNEQMSFSEDLDMWWRVAYRWPQYGYIPEPLAIYYLDRPGTLTESHRYTKLDHNIELLERHLPLARQHHQEEAFEQMAGFLVHAWIRALLFENRPDVIHRLMNSFGGVLCIRFRVLVRILMIFPRATAAVCHGISRLVRALHLRRKVYRRPNAPRPEEDQPTEK